MNGVDAARAIREHEQSANRPPVPIVIASGHNLEGADETVTPDPEVAPLVAEFLENRRGDVARLNALIASADWEGVRSLGHRMKGTGRGYGFPRITEIGVALERAGSAEDAAAARAGVSRLEQYLDRVRVMPPDGA
jgi:HPt (histidine-containing phosphotransfer) domain-containing protein